MKQRQIIIFAEAVSATSLLGPWSAPRSVWRLTRGRYILFHPITVFYAQYVVAVTLVSVPERKMLSSPQVDKFSPLSLLRIVWRQYPTF